MTAAARQGGDHALTAGLCPKSLEQQCRTDTAHRDRGYLAGPRRIQHHRLLHEARARAQQSIELPAGLEFIQPSECSDHALTHLIAGTVAFDDLQVDASLRLLAAEDTCANSIWCAQIAKDIHAVNDEQHLRVALQV